MRPSRGVPLFGIRPLLAAALAVAWFALGCASAHRPPMVPFEGELRSAPADWDAVLSRPVPIEVYAFLTGRIKVNRSLLLDISNPKIEDPKDQKLWVPVMAYLVRHPEQGDILVDAGFDSTFAKRRRGNFGRLARVVRVFQQKPGDDTLSLLGKAGVDPESLKMIIISHLHLDHTAGLPELPKGVRLVAGPNAIEGYEIPWYAPVDHLRGFDRIETLDFSRAEETELGRALDLFGDGSFFVISAPGHTAGNLSFLVNRAQGPVLLTCDASHTREGMIFGVGPGLVTDRTAADATVQRMGEFMRKHPQVLFKAGHDILDWDAAQSIKLLD